MAKKCTQSIELYDYDGKKFLLDRDTSVQLPIYAIHHDENFFDEPNNFKPERFDVLSVKDLRKNGIFLPFGNGLRICLGKTITILSGFFSIHSFN